MTLQYKTPMARKEALSYCRRCLAVMLCCVMVFGLTVRTAPRARAVGGTATIAAGAGLASNPVGAVVGLFAIAAVGGEFLMGAVDGWDGETVYGSRAYDIGAACSTYFYGVGGDVAEWFMETENLFKAKGGVAPGDTFEIPPEVAAAIQQWTATNIAFDGGIVQYQDYLLYGPSGAFALSELDVSALEAYTGTSIKSFNLPVEHLGTCVGFPPIDFDASYSTSITVGDNLAFLVNYTLADTGVSASLNMKCNFQRGIISSTGSSESLFAIGSKRTTHEALVEALEEFVSEPNRAVLFYVPSKACIYAGTYYPALGAVVVKSINYYSLADEQAVPSVDTTITKNPALDEAPTAPLTVTVPATLPTTEVGGYVVPIAETLTGEDVLNPGKEEDLPKPDATAEVWQKLKDWLEQWGQENRDLVDGKLDQIPGAVDQALNDALPGALDNALSDALPATGSKIGDQTVNEVMTEPDSLGAVLISKFPFSIPWDVAKAISLLAAPPVTPRWEVDFLAPMSDMVGGWQGSTAIVLDFGEYPIIGITTRWLSTLMFVYALATCTKRYIWTA